MIGDKCLRKLYYMRADWDKAEPYSDRLRGIFATGNELEPKLLAIFNDKIGPLCDPPSRIVGTQVSTKDKLLAEYKIGGTIDGYLEILVDNMWTAIAVADIKTCASHLFTGYSNLASLRDHTWSQRYIAQLMMYSFAHNLEYCAILFVNKSNIYTDWKLVWFAVDFEYVESLLQKAKVINEAVDKGRPPAGVNRPDLCNSCNFLSHCMPELSIGTKTKNITDKDLLTDMLRWQQLKSGHAEYTKLDKKWKAAIVKGQSAVCGPFFLTWTKAHRKETVYPAKTIWKMNVKYADPNNPG